MSRTLNRKISEFNIEYKLINSNKVHNEKFWMEADSPFGSIIIVYSELGIHELVFKDSRVKKSCSQKLDKKYADLFNPKKKSSVSIIVSGTDFQFDVWVALTKIPFGKRVSYGDLAKTVKRPKAFRAVGTAVGANPVSYLIPCHRIVRASGETGNYRWGAKRKISMLDFESRFLLEAYK